MSTYTTNSGLELIAIGEQAGTWGTTTNTNWEMTDKLVNGVKSVALSDGTNNSKNKKKSIITERIMGNNIKIFRRLIFKIG